MITRKYQTLLLSAKAFGKYWKYMVDKDGLTGTTQRLKETFDEVLH
jgi:hypothetical protein